MARLNRGAADGLGDVTQILRVWLGQLQSYQTVLPVSVKLLLPNTSEAGKGCVIPTIRVHSVGFITRLHSQYLEIKIKLFLI